GSSPRVRALPTGHTGASAPAPSTTTRPPSTPPNGTGTARTSATSAHFMSVGDGVAAGSGRIVIATAVADSATTASYSKVQAPASVGVPKKYAVSDRPPGAISVAATAPSLRFRGGRRSSVGATAGQLSPSPGTSGPVKIHAVEDAWPRSVPNSVVPR